MFYPYSHIRGSVQEVRSQWGERQGRTREEALRNIREAIDLFLEPAPQEIAPTEDHEVVALTL